MAHKSLCKIEGCGKPTNTRGWCRGHYMRWLRYDDPLGGRTPKGAVQEFIEKAAKSTFGDCIIFPYHRRPDGYGWMKTPIGPLGAHVYVAMLAHGPKPTSKHEACHTCGNGHLGCVNPRHIYWGTKSDNMKDSIAHGTGRRITYRYGEEAAAAKYPDDIIQQVRDALECGERQVAISKRFNMSQSHVSRIKNGARS